MGCDIRMAVECYCTVDAKWRFIKVLDLGRNYDLFGLLAGVRSLNFEPIDEPRGIPYDCSSSWDKQTTKPYQHSHSFLYGDEIQSRTKRAERALLKPLLQTIKQLKVPPTRVRFVFYFNS